MKKVFLFIATAALFVACTPKTAQEEAEQTVDSVSTEVVEVTDSLAAEADSVAAEATSVATEVVD